MALPPLLRLIPFGASPAAHLGRLGEVFFSCQASASAITAGQSWVRAVDTSH